MAEERQELAICILDMAVALRQPPEGCIHHTDCGSQYCSNEYQKHLAKHGLKVSMNGKRNCYDHSMVETFFKTIKAADLAQSLGQTPLGRGRDISFY
mgnify:CR=1 FL=1